MGFSLVGGVRVFSLVVAHGFQGAWALSLRHVSSVVVACGLSCPEACGILVPLPGIEPMSPALEGGFFTTGPPGKSPYGAKFKYRHTLVQTVLTFHILVFWLFICLVLFLMTSTFISHHLTVYHSFDSFQ